MPMRLMNPAVRLRVPFGRAESDGNFEGASDEPGRGSIGSRLLAALLLGVVATLAGCETKGPVQQAGENIDKGIQNAKDAINPPGPAEKAGRGLDKALSK